VTITSASTRGTSAAFAFSASEPDAVLSCALDGAAPEPCTSPRSYTGLATGPHVFAVRATDAAGNTSAPAEHSWTISPPPQPNLVITVLSSTSFTVANVGTAPAGAFVVTVTGTAPMTFGGLAPGQSQTRSFPCRPGTITAVADSGAMVAESNEADNTRTFTGTC
jgi:hypothetical protein